MLDLIMEFGRNHDLVSEPGFSPKDVKWAIDCTADGRFLEVHMLGNPEDKKNRGQEFPRCPDLSQPELVGGKEERSHFLVESAQVVALLLKGDEDEKDRVRIQGKHAFFVSLLHKASSVMPELASPARILEDPDCCAAIAQNLKGKKAKVTDKVTLRIANNYPVESEAWHDWWRSFRAGLGEKTQAGQMRCFASGKLSVPAPTHLKILGLGDVGGLGMGDALVCFDKEAFRSYGLDKSSNAAVSEIAMGEYRTALNRLIKTQGKRLAGAKVVHWYKGKVRIDEDPIAWLCETPEQEERQALSRARELLSSIEKGERPDLSENVFYALTLSGAAGRVMVRDWMEGPFEQLSSNIVRWFDDLVIVHREGGRLAPDPKFMAVLGATVRELDDLAPSFVAKMWRAAIAGEAIPPYAMAQALARVRVDFIEASPPNHARMGLLKAFSIRSKKGETAMTPYLNEEHPHTAYHCGRLMSVLADLQYDALGNVGVGVVQRYYAAASSTPALVLGRLTRNAQHHIAKSKYPGTFQVKIASIWSRIKDHVPTTFSLEEQTLFALGYYQQMAQDRAARKAKTGDAAASEASSNSGTQS